MLEDQVAYAKEMNWGCYCEMYGYCRKTGMCSMECPEGGKEKEGDGDG